MATYQELKQQAADLLAQAERMRQQEKRSVIAELKQRIQEYGVSGSELGFGATGTSPKRRSTAIVKYRSPDGATWSGRGRKPRWLADALSRGRSLQDFLA
ncbi:MAG: H-NS histone family protein [Dehalococcoidia bacterium]|nr:H-NS histone family protein [Dehalococcoidia bacterium]